MKPLRILISRHYDFKQTHNTEIWFRSIQSELSKHFSIHVTWLLYLPEKTILDNVPNNENVEYIQDFRNAIDVVKKLQPDLVISHEFPSLIDLAFFAASKNSNSFFIKDETVSINLNIDSSQNSPNMLVQTSSPFLSQFIGLFTSTPSTSMPQLTEKNHTEFFLIKFILYKFNFLFSTLFFSKLKFVEKWDILSAGVRHLFSPTNPSFNPKLQPDLNFCNSLTTYDTLIKKNYSPSGLIVVGNPLYDNFFKKRNQTPDLTISKKIQVLFAPTEFQQDSSQKFMNTSLAITRELSRNKNQFDLFIKLHPTSHHRKSFEKSIHSVDESISVFQKGDITSYIERSDVLVTFTQITSVFVYPLILRKPVIFCNFHGEKISKGIQELVFVCTKPSELQNTILEAIKMNHQKYSKIDKYLELSCFKTDGLACKRIVNSIISLINNSSKD
jgi:hypothetical protein